jgi:hypothetical protein
MTNPPAPSPTTFYFRPTVAVTVENGTVIGYSIEWSDSLDAFAFDADGNEIDAYDTADRLAGCVYVDDFDRQQRILAAIDPANPRPHVGSAFAPIQTEEAAK